MKKQKTKSGSRAKALVLRKRQPDLVDLDEHNLECLHDNCKECGGTGWRRDDGTTCAHFFSCPCSKCNMSSLKTWPWNVSVRE